MHCKRLGTLILVAVLATLAFGQKTKRKAPAKPRPIVFAVLDDGKRIEPIAYIENGKLAQAVDNASEAPSLLAFHRTYYKPGRAYTLMFGGANAGTLTVKGSDPKAECSANTAEVTFSSKRAKLKGNVMALATTIVPDKKNGGVRRLPTSAERSEIEALVRAEFEKQGLSAAVFRKFDYLNLTALDVDDDGQIELVGTFWSVPGPKTRSLLFFIAEKGADGNYGFGITDYRTIEEKDVMSGEIGMLDQGVYQERLLDLLDIDNDGTAEVFTYIQSFEGAGFNAYRRSNGKWSRLYEGANYHCAF